MPEKQPTTYSGNVVGLTPPGNC